MIKYTSILFDLDGTVTDSKEGIIQSFKHALQQMDFPVPNDTFLNPFIGPPLHDSFKQYCGFDDAKAQLAVEKYREFYKIKGLYINKVYNGIPEILQALKEQDVTLIVATSKAEIYAKQIVHEFQLDRWFSMVVGSSLDSTFSSKTDIIGYILEHGKRNPAQVLMVGDRSHDILGAINQGIDSVGVRYGYADPGELESCHPTYLVDTVAELDQLLRSFFNY